MITYINGIGYADAKSGPYEVDNGTMPDSLEALKEAVVGHRIVRVEEPGGGSWSKPALRLTLDDATVVTLITREDCCAYTDITNIVSRIDEVDHIITNVTADGDFEKWHILADMESVLELDVSWSCGNPFYYAYGFEISIERPSK